MHRSLLIRSETRTIVNEISDAHKKIAFARRTRRERRNRRRKRGAIRERMEVFAARHFRYWFYIGFSLLVRDARAAMSLISAAVGKKKIVSRSRISRLLFPEVWKGARKGEGWEYTCGHRGVLGIDRQPRCYHAQISINSLTWNAREDHAGWWLIMQIDGWVYWLLADS